MALNDVRDNGYPIRLERERTLRYDLNAFAELEDKFGSMDEAFQALQRGSMKSARSLLWAGLLHEDETLTERHVGAWVTMQNVHEVLARVTEALTAAVPQEGATEPDAENRSMPS